MELYYPQEVVDYVEELLGNLSLNGKDFVVLSPFSTRPSKLWFNEKFALVADSLIEKEGVSVLFIGSESQKDSIDDIIKKMKYKAQNLAGRTNLLQAAELIKRSNLLISVDNGNMHMAVAINTPVIALFGSTNPSLSGPYGSQHKVLRENISCSPCYRHRCKRSEDRLCMELIQVEKVVKEAHRMLAKNSV
jgi:lipopolysaccharide heptosyltransferase II